MINSVMRVFVEKKIGFDVEAKKLYGDLKENLKLTSLQSVRIINRYDVEGLSKDEFDSSVISIFSEKTVDDVYLEDFPISENEKAFAVEFLPGQYDQRADSAVECMQLITKGKRPIVQSAKVIVLNGALSNKEIESVKSYVINPVDSREALLTKPKELQQEFTVPENVPFVEGFIDLDETAISKLYSELNLAMTIDDLKMCQKYFKEEEYRNPTLTEIRVLDTYWSDHCRHTTFLTEIEDVFIEEGKYSEPINESYLKYMEARKSLYKGKDKAVTLMDIAVIAMKELRQKGILKNLDESDEINACSIKVPVTIDGKDEDWLVMFKNETHNHPTEIEPFGGAATCLGGAIRDPLSGRSYVYQAMRVTGSGDPRTKLEDTIEGKLPQRKITTEAAHGYSSYGNQIGLSTGLVNEIYDEGYVAKRMEIGAVIGAAPEANVIRMVPKTGDKIILLGGRTGRDGCGGATGSSKKHTNESIVACGAEVQKGNPPTERKIQRLFRNSEASTLIKRCNDFGAGGVAVAIGELTDGLQINLDLVPKKYEGLDGTELAISESQERMAVVVAPENVDKFIRMAEVENLEATVVAEVTDDNRLVMLWREQKIVNLSRNFLNTNGAKTYTTVKVKEPKEIVSYFESKNEPSDIKNAWLSHLEDINICSQKGLIERFDSTIGSGTVLMPYGGKYQLTPSEAMVCKIPVLKGETTNATIMSHGFNPKISRLSPFHGAVYSVVEAVSRAVAVGGDYKNMKLTFQEYFERLGNDPYRWGKPFAALLGAYMAQTELGIAAIGGKDSMSGSFNEMDVPPTLVAFAVDVVKDCDIVVSQEFKKPGSEVVFIKTDNDDNELPCFDKLKKNYEIVNKLIIEGKVLSSHTVRYGGIAEAVSKMSFGNKIGFKFNDNIASEELFAPYYGSFLLEIDSEYDVTDELKEINYKVLGKTQEKSFIEIKNVQLNIEDLIKVWSNQLESIFATDIKAETKIDGFNKNSEKGFTKVNIVTSITKPKVFIPVFPGTNCEYDSARAFEKAGASAVTHVFRNLNPIDIENSVKQMEKEIRSSQIVMIPGGFSAGDEPEGSGKFIANVFRNARLKDAVMDLLKNRDGLMLGICNGFQALIKLGLVPYGEIRDIDEDCPTLTYNNIGRHVSGMVNTKVTSNLSPWFSMVQTGDIHTVAVSHGEGRFVAKDSLLEELFKNGQVATQYVDLNNNPTMDMPFNPNGSMAAIEGITSPDGRVLGKMAHSERLGNCVHKNVPGNKDQKIFEAGVNYFK